jgi:uncharacterized protein
MSDTVEVVVKGLVPTPTGCGVFLHAESKCMAIFVDHSVAAAITMSMHKVRKPRPLTHDLIGNILAGLGATVQKVVIHDVRDETFFARIYLLQESDLGKSLAEIDSRPSDAIALALQSGAPIFVARAVWDQAEDMTWALEQQKSDDGGRTVEGG